MEDDFTDDIKQNWLPDEGWVDVEIVKMEEGTSKTGNSKYTIDFVSADDYSKGLKQDLTNIQGKRWLLRQLLEAVGIEQLINQEGRKIYNWKIEDIIGKVVSGRIEHEENKWTDRQGEIHHDKRAKFVEFKKFGLKKINEIEKT